MPNTALSFTSEFKKNIRHLTKRYRNIKSDIKPILAQLEQGETPGDQVQRTGYTVFKVRIKNSDAQKGKSGGYRIIYYLKTSTDVTLITIYSKLEQGDVNTEKIRRIISEH